MTMNNEKDFTVITGNKQEKSQINNIKELEELYQSNPQLANLLDGLDIFNTLFEMDDREFALIAPSIYQVFNETVMEQKTQSEISAMLASEQWQIDDIDREINIAYVTIDNLEEVSEIKRDFLKRLVATLANAVKQAYRLMAIEIPCEIEEGVKLPSYARTGDAGMDIVSPKEYTINPGETIIIPTGIKMAIPEGYAVLIQPRSGMSVKTKLRVANTPGLIDSGYRDEIGVIIENIEPPFKDIEYDFDEKGEIKIKSILHGQSYTIGEGQKFAQMRLVQVPTANLVKVASVQEIGENRGGGFGHTDLSE